MIFLLLLASCGRSNNAQNRIALADLRQPPDILTEHGVLEPPPTLNGTRFVSGWWPWNTKNETWLVSARENVRLQAVSIANSARTLHLDGEVLQPSRDGRIEVVIAGRSPAELPLGLPLEIELPSDLPTGRFSIDLRVPPPSQFAVRAAELRGILPEGTVRFSSANIVQAGFSLVDYALTLPAGATLETSFQAPSVSFPGQSFEIWIEAEHSPSKNVFSWPRRGRDTLNDSESLRFPLDEGRVRLRFRALGSGPPGTWVEPTIVAPEEVRPRPANLDAPNPRVVIVYIMDALRADYLGHLGGPADISPTLDRLASEGATLLDHYSVAPNTFPSIKALFLGQTPRYDPGWKIPEHGISTLAERFRSNGYRTALFSGNPYVSTTWGYDRGFDFVAENLALDELSPDGFNDNGRRVHQAFHDWLDEIPVDERLFVFIQTLHPHNPYAPPPHLEQEFTAGIDSEISGSTAVLRDIKQGRLQPSDEDRERLRGLYAASVRYGDSLIESLLAAVEKRYSPGETLFIATSDHGEELFDHGGVLHGYTLYEEQLHVPAIFWWPGTIRSCRLDVPSDHLDLQMTLRALFETPPNHDHSGRSLWPEIQNCEPHVDPHHVRFAAAASLGKGIFLARSGNLKYLWARRWGQGEGAGRSRDGEYVFDLTRDPEELENLAGTPSVQAAWLRSELLAWIEEDPGLELTKEMIEIDAIDREQLQALGYLD